MSNESAIAQWVQDAILGVGVIVTIIALWIGYMLRQQSKSVEILHSRINKANESLEKVDTKLDEHLIAAAGEAKDLENVKKTVERIEKRVFNGS